MARRRRWGGRNSGTHKSPDKDKIHARKAARREVTDLLTRLGRMGDYPQPWRWDHGRLHDRDGNLIEEAKRFGSGPPKRTHAPPPSRREPDPPQRHSGFSGWYGY